MSKTEQRIKILEDSLHAANSHIAEIYKAIHKINNHLQRHEIKLEEVDPGFTGQTD